MKNKLTKKFEKITDVKNLEKPLKNGAKGDLVRFFALYLKNIRLSVEVGDGVEYDLIVEGQKVKVKGDFRFLGVAGPAAENLCSKIQDYYSDNNSDDHLFLFLSKDPSGLLWGGFFSLIFC